MLLFFFCSSFHYLFVVSLAVKVSLLHLVDLAGSERASQTGAEGERLQEGTITCMSGFVYILHTTCPTLNSSFFLFIPTASYINRSLFTLSSVIKRLSGKQRFVLCNVFLVLRLFPLFCICSTYALAFSSHLFLLLSNVLHTAVTFLIGTVS